jgi:hypothetical protein
MTAVSDCVPGPGAGVVGVVDVVEVSLPHAEQSSTIPSTSAGRIMRLIKNPLL